jgi:ATP synthase protein I
MQNGSDDSDDMKARLAKLTSDLQARREAVKADERRSEADLSDKSLGRAMSLGFRVLTELVAAPTVGALIGWRLDLWLGTTPFLLILLLGLGVAAGFKNVYRLAAPPPARGDGDKPPP